MTATRETSGDVAVLAIHPLGHSGAFFEPMINFLPPDIRLHAPDLPGHGVLSAQPPRSFEDFVTAAERALRQIRETRVHLLGHSLGGAVAAALMDRLSAHRVVSVTLVATPFAGVPAFADRAVAVSQGGMQSVLEQTLDRWLGTDRGGENELIARAALLRMQPEGYDAVWRAFAEFAGFDRLRAVFPPSLVIGFGDDVSTPVSIQDAIAEALGQRGARVCRLDIPGAAHMGMLQRPKPVLNAFLDHVRFVTPCK